MTDGGVLVLAGPPCAGKSSVGRVLASHSSNARTIYLEIDSLFSLLLPRSDRNREDRMLAYDAAHALARALVESGRIAVLECTYARQDQRASLMKALAHLPAAPLWVIEFSISSDDAVQRFRQRTAATDLDEASLRERVENFPYSDQALQLVSSDGASDQLAHQITAWLRNQPRSVDRDQWVESGRGWV